LDFYLDAVDSSKCLLVNPEQEQPVVEFNHGQPAEVVVDREPQEEVEVDPEHLVVVMEALEPQEEVDPELLVEDHPVLVEALELVAVLAPVVLELAELMLLCLAVEHSLCHSHPHQQRPQQTLVVFQDQPHQVKMELILALQLFL